MKQCNFCQLENEVILLKSANFYLIKAKQPVVKHHFLLVSRAHFRNETEIAPPNWTEYQEMSQKVYKYLRSITGRYPLCYINPPQMQSVPHFHKHYLDGRFGVHGVANALKNYLVS